MLKDSPITVLVGDVYGKYSSLLIQGGNSSWARGTFWSSSVRLHGKAADWTGSSTLEISSSSPINASLVSPPLKKNSIYMKVFFIDIFNLKKMLSQFM